LNVKVGRAAMTMNGLIARMIILTECKGGLNGEVE
jgi:hypothetical protein